MASARHLVFDKWSVPKSQKYTLGRTHYSDLTVPTTFETPTTFEHTKNVPTTFDKNLFFNTYVYLFIEKQKTAANCDCENRRRLCLDLAINLGF